ncbi:hypothetical protein PZB74_08190 [Porifericola rhodea]|uniref:hypothetical protein n=1 Tax=Porifericola rhodea TaxID=930972 RepID=UPI002666165D|nr:hypothetical protein [Porifericola rhodea]WKN33315.1 hypothetical protein PZB74_08190 [Porifericola rhodea]
MKIKLPYIIALLVLGLTVWFTLEGTTQPGVDDLDGEPREIAFVRNENNTGPVQRVYAVQIKDTLWQEMRKYGSLMPHTKYGVTQVYFFLESGEKPDKVSLEVPVEPAYQPYCIAKYHKDAMGVETFSKYPFESKPMRIKR